MPMAVLSSELHPAVPVPSGLVEKETWHPGLACKHCGKVFPSSTRYHKHVKLHSAVPTFRCTFPGCGKTFKRKPHLTRHMATHKEERPYQCTHPGCGKTFTSNQRLSKHSLSHEKFQCDICSATFRKKAKFEQHMRAHEASASVTEQASQIRCPECNMEFFDQAALQRHMQRRHAKRQKEHKCGECGETFLHFQDLVKHRRSQHPKCHLCPDCGKAYARPAALRDHQLRVHAETHVLCPRPGCGQTFTSASNLYQHERVVHLGLKPFTCNECGQTFAYRHVLRRHRMVVHKVIPLQNGKRPLQNGRRPSSDPPQMPSFSMVAAFSRSACTCGSSSCAHVAPSASSPAASALETHVGAPCSILKAGPALVARHQAKRRKRLLARCSSTESEVDNAPPHSPVAPQTERLGEMCMY